MTEKVFEIGDLFDSIKQGSRLTKGDQRPGALPFVMSGTTNTGISSYISNSVETFPANSITVDIFGNAFYRSYEYGLGDDTGALWSNENKYNKRHLLYIAAAIQSSLHGKFDYGHKLRVSRIHHYGIYLPTDENGEIDFPYMENRIRELEAERIRELEAYLKVTSLDNYILTSAEQAVLAEFRESKRFAQFRIIDLFTVKNTRSILSRDIIVNSGSTPYLTASQANNAVGTYISHNKALLDKGDCIFIGGKTFVVTYQEEDYFSNDSHNLALYLKDESKKTKEAQIFMVAATQRALSHLYSWGDSISSRKIQKDCIELPVDTSGAIDYDFMTQFIRAQQKLTIQSVVEWRDDYITATKQVTAIA